MVEEKILKTVTKYGLINEGDKLVVAVSGGPDSMCLVDNLLSLRDSMNFELVVAHVNHGIRANSTIDEEYVDNYCKTRNIPCFILHSDIPKKAKEEKIGLEEAGRVDRYEFFDEILAKTKSNKIAIAHNSNDNVETILMNVLRGSGTSGLKGIEPIKNNKYIRPLIECERFEIEDYCERKKLNPRHDESNDDNTYTRNKIRNIVIPYIQMEFNPNFINTINRLSEISQEESKYIEEMTSKAFDDVVLESNIDITDKDSLKNNVKVSKTAETKEFGEYIALSLKKFNEQELVIKRRLILYTINSIFGNTTRIEKIHIDDIIAMCAKNIGNKFLMPNKNLKVLLKSKKIYFIKV